VSRRGGDPRRRLSRPRLPGEVVDPVAVGDAAAMVGAELGLAEPRVFTKIVDAWPELVGEMVAAHSRIRAVRDGVLEVVVDSPAWATEFRYLEGDLVARASRLVGAGVVVGVRATVEGPAPDGDRRPGSPPG
jgi:hypothetical protein